MLSTCSLLHSERAERLTSFFIEDNRVLNEKETSERCSILSRRFGEGATIVWLHLDPFCLLLEVVCWLPIQ
jgi:hypothetical protein